MSMHCTHKLLNVDQNKMCIPNASFRLACCLPHCRFDGDICTSAQAPLVAKGRPSLKQRQANQLITRQLTSIQIQSDAAW